MGRETTQFSSEHQPRKRTPRSKAQRTLLLEAIKAQAGLNEKGYYKKMVEMAFGGDTMLAKEVFLRIAPPPKPVSPAVQFDYPERGTPVEQVDAILAAVAAGKVSPDVGQQLVSMIKAKLDVLDISELAERVKIVEKALAAQQ